MRSFFYQLYYPVSLVMFIGGLTATSTTSFNAGYDDLTGAVTLIPPSPGTYKALVYNSWGVISREGLAGGYAAESTPNVILTNGLLQSMHGTPSFTVAPPYTSAKFVSFYFGCSAQTDESEVAKTVQCTITVAGFMKGSNKEIAVASYTFTPPLNVVGQVPMVKAVLPSTFIKVYNVTMIQDSPTTQALGLDNLTYTVS